MHIVLGKYWIYRRETYIFCLELDNVMLLKLQWSKVAAEGPHGASFCVREGTEEPGVGLRDVRRFFSLTTGWCQATLTLRDRKDGRCAGLGVQLENSGASLWTSG